MESLRSSWVPTFFLWLGVALCAASVIHLWPDWHYYLLPVALRPEHPHHAFLRSSGRDGLSFGAIGAFLIIINLSYLVRKRLIGLAWLGSLRSWMAFHVFTGLVGGAMVLLHSAFLVRSALGMLAFSAMSIVLVTGLLGRYVYAHTPRSVKGKELELEEIRRNLKEYQERLEKLGMPHGFFTKSMSDAVIHGSDKSLLATFFGLAAGDRELRREQKSLRQMVLGMATLKPLAKQILPLADRYCEERQWLARYQELRSLMGSWRFFHRWFAIVLIGAVLFHILIAFQMGNLSFVSKLEAFYRQFR